MSEFTPYERKLMDEITALEKKLEQAEARYSELDERVGVLSMAIVHELTDKQYDKIGDPFAALQDCRARHGQQAAEIEHSNQGTTQ
ncbi:hypothetical protein [Marinobacter salarius]|uniref:Uncharacterized protein n=1 Tax=Marinobacter salarius TaxID=1420917 RepID=A0A1W6K939_9GAMM|nr:hypothetical protein [Marinobacter salarius]ARM83934.1 hypothetical protein MARSALSMR5_01856 [Marinobacter salarius]